MGHPLLGSEKQNTRVKCSVLSHMGFDIMDLSLSYLQNSDFNYFVVDCDSVCESCLNATGP